jgi:hypothetical protein
LSLMVVVVMMMMMLLLMVVVVMMMLTTATTPTMTTSRSTFVGQKETYMTSIDLDEKEQTLYLSQLMAQLSQLHSC